MSRILHIISGLGGGGTEGVLTRLLIQGTPPGAEVGVVSLTDLGIHGPKLQAAGIPVWVARMPRGLPTWGYRKALRAAVKAFRPDLVSGWLYRGNLAALAAGRMAGGVPVVWNVRHSLHDWERERFLFQLSVKANRWFVDRPAAIVYNSHAAREQHREFGFLPRHDLVIPNGFALDRFRPNEEARREWRQKWGAEPDQVVAGLVARWHPVKNHEGFIRAASAALEADPRALFVLAGEGCDERNVDLVQLLERYGVRPSFRLLGQVDRVETVTAALDLAVNASYGEAFSNAVGEALACGVPCLATAVGDSRRIVGDNGWTGEPAALDQGLTAMVGLGRDGLQAKGRGARERMEADYRLETMNERFASLYEGLSKRSEQ